MKEQKNAPLAHSWQRVRTVQTPIPPPSMQGTPSFPQNDGATLPQGLVTPFTSADEIEHANNGPKTGPHRRLGPVRLRKMTQQELAIPETPKEVPVLPTDIGDMLFLDDPLLQDTLRHYRQKGQK